jgi:tRNA dimethylallyltransferase
MTVNCPVQPVETSFEKTNWISTYKPLIALVGPTGIGKSRIAVEVAKILGTEILTADSTQVYKRMNIGTDTPSLAEQEGIPHRLINLVHPDEPFSAGTYRRLAIQDINRLHHRGLLPLVVGGTGLYVRVLVRGIWPSPSVDWTLRHQLEEDCERLGVLSLYQELQEVDPVSAQALHPHDRGKVLRALEIYRQVGVPLSEMHRRHRQTRQPFRALLIGLRMDREALYRRIDDRVEVELEKGLVQETRELLEAGYSRELTSMKSLGYRQIAGYLQGEYSFDEAVRRLKRDTRHFAKRQMTWFRKESDIEWIEIHEQDSTFDIAHHIHCRIQQFTEEHLQLDTSA